jgi:endonuclease YncB( thermonuclease family)
VCIERAFRRFGVSAVVVLVTAMSPDVSSAGDSIYGKVIAVRSATDLTLDYGAGTYTVRLVGVQLSPPGRGPRTTLQADARAMVARLTLNRHARLRFYGRTRDGVMLGRLQTDDPEFKLKDVGLELVRAGLAARLANFDYPYGELSKVEAEARAARRGLWSTSAQP